LQTGDIILKVDNEEVNAANQLQTIIGSKRPGTSVDLTIFRDGNTFNKTVTLKPRSDSESFVNNRADKKEGQDLKTMTFNKIGMSVTNLTGSMKKKFNVENGVYVESVKHFSEAFNRGLRTGNVILEADKEKIETVEQLESIIDDKEEGDILILKVITQQQDIRLIAIEL
jgi:serine protease Do